MDLLKNTCMYRNGPGSSSSCMQFYNILCMKFNQIKCQKIFILMYIYMYDYTYIHTYIHTFHLMKTLQTALSWNCTTVLKWQVDRKRIWVEFFSATVTFHLYIYMYLIFGEEEVMVTEETFPIWKGLARLISHKSCACISKKSTTFA